METTSTVEATSTMKTATAAESTVKTVSTMEASAPVATKPATGLETTAETTAVESSLKPAASTEDRTTTTEAGPEEPAISAEAAAKPRSSSNEHAAREPIRPVVAIRHARIRVIAVVAVSALLPRSYVTIARTIDRAADSDADHNSLRMGGNHRR